MTTNKGYSLSVGQKALSVETTNRLAGALHLLGRLLLTCTMVIFSSSCGVSAVNSDLFGTLRELVQSEGPGPHVLYDASVAQPGARPLMVSVVIDQLRGDGFVLDLGFPETSVQCDGYRLPLSPDEILMRYDGTLFDLTYFAVLITIDETCEVITVRGGSGQRSSL